MADDDGDMGVFDGLVAMIGVLLQGHGPSVQGAVLADLVAMWIAGHHPTLREETKTDFVDLVDKLVPINVKALYARHGGPPPGWEKH